MGKVRAVESNDRSVGATGQGNAAHELHHIGFASIHKLTDAMLKDLPPNVRLAVEWMGVLRQRCLPGKPSRTERRQDTDDSQKPR